jgi:hypothetical protein
MPADDASARLPLGGSSGQLYQYSVIQLVPDVARGERLNAGVVLLARTADFLGFVCAQSTELWRAVAPSIDVVAVMAQLDGIAAVAAGLASGGPVAALSPAQRFHWITSPGSTVVQPSAVHTGLALDDDFAGVLEGLAARMLARR